MWNLFQKTGNIGSYMVYKEIEKREGSSFNESSSNKGEIAMGGKI